MSELISASEWKPSVRQNKTTGAILVYLIVSLFISLSEDTTDFLHLILRS